MEIPQNKSQLPRILHQLLIFLHQQCLQRLQVLTSLANSSSLQCAKHSDNLESLRHLIWILAKKNFRLGHNRDLINLDMT